MSCEQPSISGYALVPPPDIPKQVAELRTAVATLLEARRASQLHAAALQELKGSYEASVEPTDFKERLEQRAQQLAAQQA
jgi:hypothetical protein